MIHNLKTIHKVCHVLKNYKMILVYLFFYIFRLLNLLLNHSQLQLNAYSVVLCLWGSDEIVLLLVDVCMLIVCVCV